LATLRSKVVAKRHLHGAKAAALLQAHGLAELPESAWVVHVQVVGRQVSGVELNIRVVKQVGSTRRPRTLAGVTLIAAIDTRWTVALITFIAISALTVCG
jgi:hypothetical protein